MSDRATVLIVDDNPASLYATGRVLRNAGFEIIEAKTGQEALDLVGQADLVVLDVNLPDIDGFQVVRRIRQDPKTHLTPVVHLTARFVKESDKVFGLEGGADGYLTHPVEPPVLIATLNAFLRTRRAEAAHLTSEATFRAVFDNAINGIAIFSKEFRYLEVNPSMTTLLGRSRNEIVNRRMISFIPKDKRREALSIGKIIIGDGVWRGSLPLQRKDKSLIDLEWNVSFHSDPDVRLAIVSDVTEKKRAEEQRDRAEREREQLLVREQNARAEAEFANRMKDEFLATVSHELRTPLNVILGWAEVLARDKNRSPVAEKGIGAIKRSAKAQAQLISDLLDASRITSGKLSFTFDTMDPLAVTEAALEGLNIAFEEKEITVTTDLDPNVGTLKADASRFQQIIWNLVTNAVKFTPKGGTIFVSLKRSDLFTELVVRDTGQGIQPELLSVIFERFRQGDSSASRVHGGLGLGLAITKHIVDAHGGTITAESAGVGKGASFIVRFPTEDISESTEEAVIPPAPIDLGKMKILVVEDDVSTREFMEQALSDFNVDVRVASNLNEAIDAVDSFQPEVLVSDIGMPGGDGYELIRRIRGRGISAMRLPAIALTAYAHPEDQQKALSAGFQMHVSKPVDVRLLTEAIRQLTSHKELPG